MPCTRSRSDCASLPTSRSVWCPCKLSVRLQGTLLAFCRRHTSRSAPRRMMQPLRRYCVACSPCTFRCVLRGLVALVAPHPEPQYRIASGRLWDVYLSVQYITYSSSDAGSTASAAQRTACRRRTRAPLAHMWHAPRVSHRRPAMQLSRALSKSLKAELEIMYAPAGASRGLRQVAVR